jgi:hypothetical protein
MTKQCLAKSPNGASTCSLDSGHSQNHKAHVYHDVTLSVVDEWPNELDKFYRPANAPLDVKSRKTYPMFSGLLRYFPDALMEVAHVSFVGNEQHNPGTPLHWDRSKSTDEPDALLRHLKDAGTLDTDGIRHSAKVAWRALALLQKELEAATVKPASIDIPF